MVSQASKDFAETLFENIHKVRACFEEKQHYPRNSQDQFPRLPHLQSICLAGTGSFSTLRLFRAHHEALRFND